MKHSTPLRVTWDWRWPPAAEQEAADRTSDEDRLLLVAEELARAKVLLLEIGYPSAAEVKGGLLRTVLDRLSSQVSLVLTSEEAELTEEQVLDSLGVSEEWIDATPVGGGAGCVPASPPPTRENAGRTGIRIYLTSGNVASASAFWGNGYNLGDMANDFFGDAFGDGTGDFNMNMNASGAGNGRGWDRRGRRGRSKEILLAHNSSFW